MFSWDNGNVKVWSTLSSVPFTTRDLYSVGNIFIIIIIISYAQKALSGQAGHK